MQNSTTTRDMLQKHLDNHAKWLAGEPGGVRLDLSAERLNGPDAAEVRLCQVALARLRFAPMVDLQKANFRGADLREVQFLRASLNAADFSGAELRGADFSGAHLSHANFHGASLQDARFYQAQLVGADLSGATLHKASLHMADLRDANLRLTQFLASDLRGANLNQADLRGANFYRSLLLGPWASPITCLSEAKFDDVILPDGMRWSTYLKEVVPALLTAGGKSLREVLETGCWDCHSWANCPLHAAFGVNSVDDVPALLQQRAREFLWFFDAKLIPKPALPNES